MKDNDEELNQTLIIFGLGIYPKYSPRLKEFLENYSLYQKGIKSFQNLEEIVEKLKGVDEALWEFKVNHFENPLVSKAKECYNNLIKDLQVSNKKYFKRLEKDFVKEVKRRNYGGALSIATKYRDFYENSRPLHQNLKIDRFFVSYASLSPSEKEIDSLIKEYQKAENTDQINKAKIKLVKIKEDFERRRGKIKKKFIVGYWLRFLFPKYQALGINFPYSKLLNEMGLVNEQFPKYLNIKKKLRKEIDYLEHLIQQVDQPPSTEVSYLSLLSRNNFITFDDNPLFLSDEKKEYNTLVDSFTRLSSKKKLEVKELLHKEMEDLFSNNNYSEKTIPEILKDLKEKEVNLYQIRIKFKILDLDTNPLEMLEKKIKADLNYYHSFDKSALEEEVYQQKIKNLQENYTKVNLEKENFREENQKLKKMLEELKGEKKENELKEVSHLELKEFIKQIKKLSTPELVSRLKKLPFSKFNSEEKECLLKSLDYNYLRHYFSCYDPGLGKEFDKLVSILK